MSGVRVMLFMHQIRDRMGGGGMVAMWNLLHALEARGCAVTVAASHPAGDATTRGRPVLRAPGPDVFAGVDLVLTAGAAASKEAVRMVRRGGSRARVVVFVHSVMNLEGIPAGVHHVVWASLAMRDYATRHGYGSPATESVLWPLIDPERVKVEPGDRVTLVNMIPEKGGDLFWRIAERMPEVKFLAVRGGWRSGRQVIPTDVPENVEVLPYQDDCREVFRRTRLLLYPKGKGAGPGWMHGVGMTALEAACSGIPTIAYPGPGLVESMGEAGIFVRSTQPGPWVDAVDRVLGDEDTCRWASAAALGRSRVLDPGRITDAVLALAWSPERAVA